MTNEILIAQGIFSRLTIALNDDVADKLAVTERKDNPLADVEAELNAILVKFERAYFDAVNPPEGGNE